jgi:hypothetical protein
MLLRQIAVLLKITPLEDLTSGLLQIQDTDAMQSLPLKNTSFVLSLDLELGDDETSYSHGYIRSLDDGVIYPIRSNRSLFDALRTYLCDAGERA